MSTTSPGRARRALAAVAKVIGLGAVFTAATVGGVLLHMGLPATSRFLVAHVGSALDGSFKGKIVLKRLGRLHLNRAEGVDGEVYDPEGKRVIYVQDASARIGTLSLILSIVQKKPTLVHIPELTVGWADVVLEENAAGELSIARAFESPTPDTGAPSNGSHVTIDKIRLGHVWVHGHMSAVPVIDADVDSLDGSLESTKEYTDLNVKSVRVRARGLDGREPDGMLTARAYLPAATDEKMVVSAHYDGRVGQIAAMADVSLAGDVLAARVEVPEATPQAVAAIAPDTIMLGAPVSVDATVNGVLPTLHPVVNARIGDGEVKVTGLFTIPGEGRPDFTIAARVDAKDIDLSLVQQGSPESRLTAVLDASLVAHENGSLNATFHHEGQPGEIAGQLIPAASLNGEATERSVSVWGHIAEPGAPTVLAASIQPKPGEDSPSLVEFHVDTEAPDLNAIPRIGPIGRGRAHVKASGKIDIKSKQILTATTSAEVTGFARNGVQLGRGFITGSAEGPLEKPRFHAEVRGSGLRAAGYGFTSVRAGAAGTPEEMDVTTTLLGDSQSPHAKARAHLSIHKDVVVRGADVRVERGDRAAMAKVEAIRVAGGAVDIRGVEATGFGDPLLASARISNAGISVKAQSRRVDLYHVVKLVAPEQEISGDLAFDADATIRGRDVKGTVSAEATGVALRGLVGASVRVNTTVDGTHFKGDVVAGIAEAGKVEISAPDVRLGGPALDPASWKKATGDIAIDGKVLLDRALALLPEEYRPVESASGAVTLKGSASRQASNGPPTLEIAATTDGLQVVAKRAKVKNPDGTVTLGPTPWSTVGLDGQFKAAINGSTGRTEVSAALRDAHGPVVSASASAALPFDELLKGPDHVLATITDLPLEAKVDMPRRSIDNLPKAVGELPIKGNVEVNAELNGTMRTPKVIVNAKGTQLLPRRRSDCVEPMDIAANVTYDGRRVEAQIDASRKGQSLLAVNGDVKVDAAKVLAGDPLTWEASGDVTFSKFPLDVPAVLMNRPIAGNVSGKVSVRDLHRDATLEADLDLRNLAFDRTAIPDGKVHVDMKGGALSANARLDQSDGYLETTAKGSMSWGAALAPDVDLAKAVDITIKAKNFRANSAAPFVQDVITDIDGRVDADAKVHIVDGGKDGFVDGSINLRDGAVEVPQLGEKLHAIRGRVIMKPWGTLRFESFYAEAPTGYLTAAGTAVLKGLSLQTANANVRIPQGQSIPISVQGVPMGRAHGEISARAEMSPDGKRLDLTVDVPVLHVALPQSTGHSVQDLEPDKTVRIGHYQGKELALLPLEKPEEPRPPSDMEVRAKINLGGDVDVKRDTTLFAAVRGSTTVTVTDKAHVSGQIRLDRGKLEVQGKVFTIDRGVISFVGDDPSDPLIIASASWDAPGSVRVVAEFSGHVSNGKLNLRSDPPLTQDEILALIMFGSPDGSFGGEAPSQHSEQAQASQQSSAMQTGAKAAGMAGGVVTQGINKAISGITTADITTRVDTSDSNSPRPEVAVQLSKNLSARLGYKLGATGENPDRTQLTLEWRFIRNWSLVGVVGDHGSTALDVVWRLRY